MYVIFLTIISPKNYVLDLIILMITLDLVIVVNEV